MRYFHVDVFASRAAEGNGLCVVFPDREYSYESLLAVTREFRQFESIFIYKQKPDGSFPCRIFTCDEELDFAGHPMLGAAAVIHSIFFPGEESSRLILAPPAGKIALNSTKNDGCFSVEMNQGTVRFGSDPVSGQISGRVLQKLNLDPEDLDNRYPVETASAGLPYMLIPLRKNLKSVKVSVPGLEQILSEAGAKFTYLFDTETLECRSLDNTGRSEDAATGSAAGPLAAYLVRHGIRKENSTIKLYQGRFVNRPCTIETSVINGESIVRGNVVFFAEGKLVTEALF